MSGEFFTRNDSPKARFLSRRSFLKLSTAGLLATTVPGCFVRLTNSESSGKLTPPGNEIYTGLSVNRPQDFDVEASVVEWEEWLELVGLDSVAISHEFTWFDATDDYPYAFAERRGATPLSSIEFTNAPTPEVARAGVAEDGETRTDALILRHAQNVRAHGGPVFVRLGHEMNGHWYPWCAFEEDGTPRENTATDYIRAWRRFVIIFRGGRVSEVNQRLAQYELPPFDERVEGPNTDLPAVQNAVFVWCSSAESLPNIRGNKPSNYYPGDEFVDWVGQDVYHQPWATPLDLSFRRMSDFYGTFSEGRGKPYMLAEWGLRPPREAPEGFENNDDPDFIRRVLQWAEERRRVRALVYWSWTRPEEGDYRLENYPKAAQTLAEGWSGDRYVDRVRE